MLPVVGTVLAVILGFGLHVNLSASAPRGLYRTVAGHPTRGAWVVACVTPQAAAFARERGYLGPGPCAGGVQPVVEPVRGGRRCGGDRPEAVTVNGQRLVTVD